MKTRGFFSGPYLNSLPNSGNLLDVLNNKWSQLTSPMTTGILDYDVEVRSQTRFALNFNGNFVFNTSKYEDRFRKTFSYEKWWGECCFLRPYLLTNPITMIS